MLGYSKKLCIFSLSFILLSISFVFALLVSIPNVSAQSTGFTNDNDIYFTGSSSDPSTLYQDGLGGNLDAGMQICGFGSRFVAGFYALNVSGSMSIVQVTYGSFSEAFSNANTNVGGGCFAASGGFMTISPSQLTTPDPDVQKAAFPGKLWIGYAASANPGAGAGILGFEFADSNAQLLGSYSVQRSYSQSTNQISVSTPTISFQTSSTSFSKSASDASFGIASDRQMVIGVCEDTDGAFCSDGNSYATAAFPLTFATGLSNVNDQNQYTRYVVINGIGNPMCIGSNLQVTIASVQPDPVYYSQTLRFNVSVQNDLDTPFELSGGNVDVTSTFIVNVRIYNTTNSADIVYNQNVTVTTDVNSGGSIQLSQLEWPAYARSGGYTISATVDAGSDIVECQESDNVDTDTFTLLPITLPDIFIDGNETTVFPAPNVPYNVSFSLKNSDNTTLSNAQVRIIEENGLSVMAPTQIYNRSLGSNTTEKAGTSVQTMLTFVTDVNGNASLTFIPTYNLLYNPVYGITDFSEYVGNYSLILTGTQEDLQEFAFINPTDESVSANLSLNLTNTNYTGPYVAKDLPQEIFAAQAMNFIQHIFANFVGIIAS